MVHFTISGISKTQYDFNLNIFFQNHFISKFHHLRTPISLRIQFLGRTSILKYFSMFEIGNFVHTLLFESAECDRIFVNLINSLITFKKGKFPFPVNVCILVDTVGNIYNNLISISFFTVIIHSNRLN